MMVRSSEDKDILVITDTIGEYDVSVSLRHYNGMWIGDIRVWREGRDVTRQVYGMESVPFSAVDYYRAVSFALTKLAK